MTAGTEFRTKAILGLWRYRRGAAAFVANRTRIPFVQCRDIIEWNWHILIEAYDEGARFQEAGRRILAAGQMTPGRLRPVFCKPIKFQIIREVTHFFSIL